MSKTYLKLIAVVALALMLIPIFPALPTSAQASPIVEYSSEIVPGGTAYVTINVNNPGQLITIQLIGAANNRVWVTVTRSFAIAGTYKVEFSVPKLLPDIGPGSGDLAYAYIEVTMGYDVYDTDVIPIIPVVEVSPSSTTNIDLTGATKSITVKAYGLPDDVTISYVNVSAMGITKYWDIGPLTPNSDGSITISNLNFSDLLPNPWLPKGTFSVILSTDNDYVNGNESAGSLSIEPAILMTPTQGTGKAGQVYNVVVSGYGFPPNATIESVEFINQNFTGKNYVFKPNTTVTVNNSGCFNLTQLVPSTNMTAGWYYINVTWRTALVTYLSGGSTGTLTSSSGLYTSTLTYTENGILINGTTWVNATRQKELVNESSLVHDTIVSVPFTYRGVDYLIEANLTAVASSSANITFKLYNMTPSVPYVIQSWAVNTSNSVTVGGSNYWYAWLAFDLPDTTSSTTGTDHSAIPTSYTFISEAMIDSADRLAYINISKMAWVINDANVTIGYYNPDTGTSKVWTFQKSDLSISDETFEATVSYIDSGEYNVSIIFSADLDMNETELTGTVTNIPSYDSWLFKAPAYLVRPYLELVNSTNSFAPGDKVTVAAYGFAPNSAITFMWDETTPINIVWAETSFSGNQVTSGKDGNVTFTFTVPEGVAYGAHYLRGRDTYGYEYTIQIIVGAAFYWYKVQVTPLTNTSSNTVTATHPVYGQVVASICGNYAAMKYCGICSKATAGGFDYLGDKINVTVSGLSVGEQFTVYFGNIKIGTYVANHTVETISFLVPPVPEGTYYITIQLPTGSYTIQKFFNGKTFVDAGIHVVPKLLVVSLGSGSKAHVPILVGPGIVKVIGTGFPVGASFKSLSINGTAVLSYQNGDLWNWYVDTDGTVKAYGGLEPGLFIPMLEPGLYEISLVYSVGNETGKSVPGYVYVINNLTNVATQKSLNNFEANVKASLDDLGSSINDLMSMATQANSQLTGLQVSLSQIGFKVDTANNYLTTMMSNMNKAMSDLSALKDTVTSMQGTLGGMQSTLSSVNSGVNDIKGKLSSLKLSVDLTPVTSRLDSISSNIAALKAGQTSISNGISALSGKVTQVQSTLSGISSQLSGISSTAQQALSAANAAKASADNAASAASGAANAVNAAKTELAGKIDTGVYVLYIATIFAVLAFAFAILAWAAARKAASK